MAGPLDFWQIVKEINPAGIRDEANAPFKMAAVAAPDDGAALRRLMGMDTQAIRDLAGPRWLEVALPMGDDARREFARANFAVAFSAVTDPRVSEWLLDPNDRDTLAAAVDDILDRYPDLTLALPRYIPAFRRDATTRIINRTARTNGEVALVSAIPGILPWTAVLLPITSLPDMALLTKNQAMMALKIAAAYGKEIEPAERMKELAGVIGAAIGWRALARELLGVVPGGVGAVAKAAVAYAGTVATGRAVQAFYETGTRPTPKQMRAWFQEALDKGREAAREAMERVRERRKNPKPESEPSPA